MHGRAFLLTIAGAAALLLASSCSPATVRTTPDSVVGPSVEESTYSSDEIWASAGGSEYESYGAASEIPASERPRPAAEALLPLAVKDPGFTLWWSQDGFGYSPGAPDFERVSASIVVAEVIQHARPKTTGNGLSWADLEPAGEYTVVVSGDEGTGGIYSIRTRDGVWAYSPNGLAPGESVVEAVSRIASHNGVDEVRLAPMRPVSWLAVKYRDGTTAAYPVWWIPNFEHRVQDRLVSRGTPFPLSAIAATVTVGE